MIATVPERRPSRRAGRPGYTLAEMAVVLAIASVLMTVTVSGFRSEMTRRRAEGARNAFAWILRRARTVAVQRGTQVNVTYWVDAQRVRIATAGGTIIHETSMAGEFSLTGTVVSTGEDPVTICYAPRGFAVSCGSTLPATFNFIAGSDTSRIAVQSLGQTGIL